MGYHPEILGLLILACSFNLLPTAADEDNDLSASSMKTRLVRRAPAGMWSNQGSRATNEGSDSLIFPDDTGAQKFTPKFGKVTPACANGTTFCETVDSYPSQYLENILANSGKQFNGLFGNDLLNNSLTQRLDFDENPLCQSVEQVVYPKTAKNKDNQWLFVVNQGEYRQGIRIEKCVAPSGTQSCAFTEGFPIGYRTECQQKHIYRRLLALNEDGKTVTDSFQLPSCCACVVIPTTLTSRAGSPGKKENASKQQIISKTN
ncbi:spaetzle domain-containing protein isoform X2 [Rhodnius prolixus]|uniref:spaetzle domain-containing protein isoform X2 n=1 Tax=Rhodnius prolixus TaxID=13249 RepID=UPI003D18B71B